MIKNIKIATYDLGHGLAICWEQYGQRHCKRIYFGVPITQHAIKQSRKHKKRDKNKQVTA